jgi:hypothetical protein
VARSNSHSSQPSLSAPSLAAGDKFIERLSDSRADNFIHLLSPTRMLVCRTDAMGTGKTCALCPRPR